MIAIKYEIPCYTPGIIGHKDPKDLRDLKGFKGLTFGNPK